MSGDSGRTGVVFLSDGADTVNRKKNNPDWLADWLKDNQPKPPIPVHTIALEAGEQEASLCTIAGKTGGRYHFIESAQDLADIYWIIAGCLDAALITSTQATMLSGDPVDVKATVSAGATEATFAFNWNDPAALFTTKPLTADNQVQFSVRDPKKKTFTTPVATGHGFVIFKIPNPVAGVYSLSAWYVGKTPLSHTIAAFDNGDVTAEMIAPRKPVPVGSAATVELRLSDGGGESFDDATVTCSLDSPLVSVAEAAETHAERLKAISVGGDPSEEFQSVGAKLAALQRQTGEKLLRRESQAMVLQRIAGGVYEIRIGYVPKAGSYTVRVVASGTAGKSKAAFQRTAAVSFLAEKR